jgi:hypothetical protein
VNRAATDAERRLGEHQHFRACEAGRQGGTRCGAACADHDDVGVQFFGVEA